MPYIIQSREPIDFVNSDCAETKPNFFTGVSNSLQRRGADPT